MQFIYIQCVTEWENNDFSTNYDKKITMYDNIEIIKTWYNYKCFYKHKLFLFILKHMNALIILKAYGMMLSLVKLSRLHHKVLMK